MTKAESPAHVFNIFFQRFPSPPALIHYDRSCQLHVYALKREPFFFQSTIFRVDITHAQTHKACSKTYDPKTFRQRKLHSSKYAYINSQICEQTNSLLKKFRSMCGFMTQQNFLLFNRLMLYRYNREKAQVWRRKSFRYNSNLVK